MAASFPDVLGTNDWQDITALASHGAVANKRVTIQAKSGSFNQVYFGGAVAPEPKDGVSLPAGASLTGAAPHIWVRGLSRFAVLIEAVASVAPVIATLSAAGSSPAFAPILDRPFNVTHKRSGDFAGAYNLVKRFVGDATLYVALGYSDLVNLPETFALTETEAGVEYLWDMAARTAGSVNVRISA